MSDREKQHVAFHVVLYLEIASRFNRDIRTIVKSFKRLIDRVILCISDAVAVETISNIHRSF